MAIKIGITGGIGSGKSTIAQLMETMSIPVYIADTEAKRIIRSDKEVQQALNALVGQDIFSDGELNRPLLASYMFGHPDRIETVNSIVHPHVKEDFRRWTSRQAEKYPFVAFESAILIEAGFRDEVDCLVMVYAPQAVRIERCIRRDHTTEEQVVKRIAAQMSDEVKYGKADYVVLNDGMQQLIPQVIGLISSLSGNNNYLCTVKNKL